MKVQAQILLAVTLVLVVAFVLRRNVRHIRETYLDQPLTASLYFNAGLYNVAPGLPPDSVQMSLTNNDVLCTYFNSDIRAHVCNSPTINTVTCPVGGQDSKCQMFDATSQPDSASDCVLKIFGDPYRFVKTCLPLTLSAHGFENTTPFTLQFFLSRTLFFRVPNAGLMKVDYPQEFVYTWPTPGVPFHVDLPLVNDRLIDDTTNTTSLDTMLTRSSKGVLEAPATLYYVVPQRSIHSLPAPSTGILQVVTMEGIFTPAASPAVLASVGSLQVLQHLVDSTNLMFQFYNAQLGVVQYATTLPIGLQPGNIKYCLSILNTGSTLFALTQSQCAFLSVTQQTAGMLNVTQLPDGANRQVPDLWAAFKRFSSSAWSA